LAYRRWILMALNHNEYFFRQKILFVICLYVSSH